VPPTATYPLSLKFILNNSKILMQFLRATAGTAVAHLNHRNSVCPSVRLSSGVFRIWQRGGQGEHMERIQGQSPWLVGQGAKPPEAETLFAFERLMEATNSPIFFLKFTNAENHSIISDAISHGDFNRILYRYEKRPSNIVEFCNSCWKTAKNASFHIKSP